MTKGVIDFSYDAGKSYTKKRKRIPGANADKKPEVKQFNPCDGTGGLDGMEIYPFVKERPGSAYQLHLWRMKPLIWPVVGTSFYNRIGNQFFLKSLRFKGYLVIHGNVIRPIRWRLKLYRFDKPIPEFKYGNAYTYTVITDVYLSLFKNYQNYPNGISTDNVIVNSRHNFYKMVKNLPKDRPYTSKVIASGVVPVNNGKENTGTKVLGSGSVGYQQTFSTKAYQLDAGCIPIDVLVKCNDRIVYSLDDDQQTYSAAIQYAIVLEDDWGVGVEITPPDLVSVQGETTWYNADYQLRDNTFPCYEIKLFCRGYFTDD